MRAGIRTLVDVRRFPSSRRNPQFNRDALADALARAGIAYAARMRLPEWLAALAEALAEPGPPCFLCAETLWWRCHRRLIAELLVARGYEVVHLLGPHKVQQHRLSDDAEVRDGALYLCGEQVA